MSYIREYSKRQADLLNNCQIHKNTNSESLVTEKTIEKKIPDAPKTTESMLQHPVQSKNAFRPTIESTILLYNKVGGTPQGEKLIE